LNDCVFPDKRELLRISQEIGQIDVLLTQFSYANWVGNPENVESRRIAAEMKLEELARRVRVLRPKALIPAASYVWFSHEENCYMNVQVNKTGDVHRFAKRKLGLPTHVLYPGDEWIVGEDHDSAAAIENYERDYDRVAHRSEFAKSPPIALERLMEAQRGYVSRVSRRNNALLLNALPSAVVFLEDLNIVVRMSFRGLQPLRYGASADIALSSDSLHYCFMREWGGDALSSNARYRVPAGGNAQKFFWLFRLASHNSAGAAVDFPVFFSQIVKRLSGNPAVEV
jgi:UDP-MurNAc hydroxylase